MAKVYVFFNDPRRSEFYKFSKLMTSADFNELTKLCILISKIYEKVYPP